MQLSRDVAEQLTLQSVRSAAEVDPRLHSCLTRRQERKKNQNRNNKTDTEALRSSLLFPTFRMCQCCPLTWNLPRISFWQLHEFKVCQRKKKKTSWSLLGGCRCALHHPTERTVWAKVNMKNNQWLFFSSYRFKKKFTCRKMLRSISTNILVYFSGESLTLLTEVGSCLSIIMQK